MKRKLSNSNPNSPLIPKKDYLSNPAPLKKANSSPRDIEREKYMLHLLKGQGRKPNRNYGTSTELRKGSPGRRAYKPQSKTQSNEEMVESDNKGGTVIAVSFLAMVVIGLANKIFGKLETIPMVNYPIFLGIASTVVYVPLSFMYIIPMLWCGTLITKEAQRIPKYQFAVMGFLDGVAGIMQMFATTYITNGSLIILISQAAIPISMIMSKVLMNAKFENYQYAGALVVVAGLIVVLYPQFGGQSSNEVGGNDTVVWCGVMVLSTIPMCLSSVYKERALGQADIDVVYLNGWVAIFQTLVAIVGAIPSAYVQDISITDLPYNLVDGWKCYMGEDMILEASPGMHVDHCEQSFLFVSCYIVFNLGYNILIIMILKFGSASILYLAMTIMVPLGNVAFSLPFVPGNQPMKTTDIIGLCVIMTGLCVYRFAGKLLARAEGKRARRGSFLIDDESSDSTRRFFGLNQLELMEPMSQAFQKCYDLTRSPLQIRTGYYGRLGLPPSPAIARSPNIKRRGGSNKVAPKR